MQHLSRTVVVIFITFIAFGSALAETGILVLHVSDARGKRSLK